MTCWEMSFCVFWIKMWCFAVCEYENLCCQTCTRQLYHTVSNHNQTTFKTYFFFLLCQMYFFPIAAFSCTATSHIIVELFDALSHIMWPTCKVSVSLEWYITPTRLPFLNSHPFNYFEECL